MHSAFCGSVRESQVAEGRRGVGQSEEALSSLTGESQSKSMEPGIVANHLATLARIFDLFVDSLVVVVLRSGKKYREMAEVLGINMGLLNWIIRQSRCAFLGPQSRTKRDNRGCTAHESAPGAQWSEPEAIPTPSPLPTRSEDSPRDRRDGIGSTPVFVWGATKGHALFVRREDRKEKIGQISDGA
jgi:hypothetical protein